jgi:hypothetical protein
VTTNWFGEPDLPEDDNPQPWTLADIYADLGTINDVSAHLNVNSHRVRMWIDRRERLNSPRPVREFGSVHIYSIQQWADWFENFKKGKKPGTRWTDGGTEYVEKRVLKLHPGMRYGVAGDASSLILKAAHDEPRDAD